MCWTCSLERAARPVRCEGISERGGAAVSRVIGREKEREITAKSEPVTRMIVSISSFVFSFVVK